MKSVKRPRYSEPKERSYPWIGEAPGGMVVLFELPGKGVVLYDPVVNGKPVIGFSVIFSIDKSGSFTDFEGEIALSND